MFLLGLFELGTIAATNMIGPGSAGWKLLYSASILGIFAGWGAIFGFIAGGLSIAVSSLVNLMTEKRVEKPKWAARIYTGLTTFPVAYFCANVFEGRRASEIPMKEFLIPALAAALLAVSYGAIRIIIGFKHRLIEGRLKKAQIYGGLAIMAGISISMHVADRKILPGLYGFFHLLLAMGSMISALLFVYGSYLELTRRSIRFWGGVAKPINTVIAAFTVLFLGGLGLLHIGRHNRSRAAGFNNTVITTKLLQGAKKIRALPEPDKIKAQAVEDIPPPLAPGIRLPGRNIVFITVDALRSDRVGLYGSRKSITPNIDRIFAGGTRFERAYTPIPQTSYAIASLMTGSYLLSPQRVRREGRRVTIPEVMHRFTYKTAAFYPPAIFFLDHKFFLDYERTRLGFGHYVVQYHKTDVEDDAAERVDAALAVLQEWNIIEDKSDTTGGENKKNNTKEEKPKFFLWLHFFDPHHPYVRREGFGPPGNSDVDRYESEIAYVDAQVGRLYDALKENTENTIFVLTADHGEAFGEHGTSTHGTSLYDEQIRVPFLIAGGGVPERVISAPVDLTALAPTMLSLVDLPLPATMEGTDLTPFMGDAPETGMPPAFARLAIPGKNLEMAAAGPYKLIRDTVRSTTELYNLLEDPQERNPLDIDNSREAAKTASRLLGHIEAKKRRMLRHPAAAKTERTKKDLGRKLASDDPEERRIATRTLLSEEPDAKYETKFIRLMNEDPDVEVRHRAAILAARLGVESAYDHVEKLLERSDLPLEMINSGAFALARAGRNTAVEHLLFLFNHASGIQQQREILELLGSLKCSGSMELLLQAIHIPGAALEGVRAIGRIADPRGIKPLLKILDSPSTQAILRAEIIKTLGKIGTAAAIDRIKLQIKIDTDPLVTAACLAALVSNDAVGSYLPGWRIMSRKHFALIWPSECKTGTPCKPPNGSLLELPMPAKAPGDDVIEIWIVSHGETSTPASISFENSDYERSEAASVIPAEESLDDADEESSISSPHNRNSDPDENDGEVYVDDDHTKMDFLSGSILLLKGTAKKPILKFSEWPDGLDLQFILIRKPLKEKKQNRYEQ